MKIRNHKHFKNTRWIAPSPNWEKYQPKTTLMSHNLEDDLVVLRLKELDVQKVAWRYSSYTGNLQSFRYVISPITNQFPDLENDLVQRKTFAISHRKAIRRAIKMIEDGEL